MSHAWMSFYVGDYLADTGHLSAAEHGAYLMLILHYWQNRGLPDDEKKIAKLSRLTKSEWADSRDTLADLFLPGWRHKRIEDELAKADAIIAQRKAAGKAGASARYGDRMAEALQTDAHLHSPLPKKDISSRKEKNGEPVDTTALIASATRAVKRGETSNYMMLKDTDTRRPNAEAWWFANYGTADLPWQSKKSGRFCRVPWEAVRYAIPPPESRSEFVPTPPPRNTA